MTTPAIASSGGCFDGIAGDACWQAFTPEDERKVEAFLRRWQVRPGDRVLEPGCGSGRLTVVLAAQVGPAGRVVAFDSSPAFIARAAARGLPLQVTLQTAAAETIPLSAGAFDHVICFNVFPHLVPQAALAARLAASLRPGGVFWIAHTCSRAFVNDIHRCGPASIHDHILPAPGELTGLLRSAGLDGIEIDDGPDHFLARAVRPDMVLACGRA
jgi:SAM-dependent methyltransferase